MAQGLLAYIEHDVPLESTRHAFDTFAGASFIAFNESLQTAGLSGELFSRGQQAANGNDQGKLERCIECLELLFSYIPNTWTSRMRDILVGQAEGHHN